MDKKTVLSRADDLERRKPWGQMLSLDADLDICLWVEPTTSCSYIDRAGSSSVFLAAINYGCFVAEASYEVSMRKGGSVIDLKGVTKGKLRIPAPPPERRSPNWDSCSAHAIVSRQRDDCYCKWTSNADRRTVTATLQVSMETSSF